MKKIINVIHTSHTDIGYTDNQSRILTNHINYIKTIINNFAKNSTKFNDWKWVCESFYIVEKFFENATKFEIDQFILLVKRGNISISASYLNLSELANYTLYNEKLKKIVKKMKGHSIKLSSAICNDVNGFSLSYAKSLKENNINNLYFGLHTHHGMFPAYRKQSPFFWEVKKGEKILVWIGEHYMIGNNLGLVDVAFGNYVTQSDFEEGFFDEEKQLSEAHKRIKKYLQKLEEDDYVFKNIPISVMGENTDNAPCNFKIIDRINKLNKIFKDDNVEFKMVTLEEFFDSIRKEEKFIPTYKGEWPDWWTDGSGSTPQSVRIFRQAQRNYDFINQLKIKDSNLDALEENLLLFSEHTWGAWNSVENPFSFWTHELSFVKKSYASNALLLSNNILDNYFDRKIFKLRKDNKIFLKLTNFNKSDLSILINLNKYLSSWEINEMKKGFTVKSKNKVLKSFSLNKKYINIENEIYYCVISNPMLHQKIEIEIAKDHCKKDKMTTRTTTLATDGINDVYGPYSQKSLITNNNTFENDFFSIKWNNEIIFSIFDKKENKELLDNSLEGFFTPIYELSEIPYVSDFMNFKRRASGRNRKLKNVKRYFGKISNVEVEDVNNEITTINFFYSIKGIKYLKMSLKILNHSNIIDVRIKLIKKPEWALENLYFALPFLKNKILFEKWELFQPLIDQIPGSLIDYYSIQNGIVIELKNNRKILISSMDNNLFWTGPLQYQDRFLAHDKNNTMRKPNLYVWAMNNAWETNFNVDLSGFHEFRFKVALTGNDGDSKEDLKLLNKIYDISRL